MNIPLNQNLTDLKRSGIRVFTNLARETPDCAMLTIGEPDLDTPCNIKAAVAHALDANDTHYAPNQGTLGLRNAIAEFETNRGNPTNPENVLVTVGATQALFTALLGILNPGDELIVPIPAFSLYETIATVAGAKLVPLDVEKTNFQIEKTALEALITDKTKAILLNSPNNPTGVVLSEESLANVKSAVLGRPIFVVCDNVYHSLCYLPNCPDLTKDPQLSDQIILCQSFSKPYAMTGWRMGYLTCPGYVMDRLLLLSAAEIAAVPTFLQEAAIEALKTDVSPMKKIYENRRAYITRRLTQMGLTYPEPQGAFYIFVDIRQFGLDCDTFCRRMITEGKVAAVPGTCFGKEGYIRLSYCYCDQELQKALDRMEDFIRKL